MKKTDIYLNGRFGATVLVHERAIPGLLERGEEGASVLLLPLEVVLVASNAESFFLELIEIACGRLAAAVAVYALEGLALNAHVAHRLHSTAERVQHGHVPALLHVVFVRARARIFRVEIVTISS